MVMSDWSYTTSTIDEMNGGIKVEKDIRKEDRMKTVKTGVRYVVIGLVATFVGAVTNSVVGRVEGPKFAKVGAKLGGVLVGMHVGDQVSDYVLGLMDRVEAKVEEVKNSLDEE